MTKPGLGRRDGHRALAEQVLREEKVCWICGEPGTGSDPLVADHLIARANGGKNVRSNYQRRIAAATVAVVAGQQSRGLRGRGHASRARRSANDLRWSWDSYLNEATIERGQDSTSRPKRESPACHLEFCTAPGFRSSASDRYRGGVQSWFSSTATPGPDIRETHSRGSDFRGTNSHEREA